MPVETWDTITTTFTTETRKWNEFFNDVGTDTETFSLTFLLDDTVSLRTWTPQTALSANSWTPQTEL